MLIVRFCCQGDGEDGGYEGGGERSGRSAPQVKTFLTFSFAFFSSSDLIINKVTFMPLLQKCNFYFQHFQRVDGVHHLLVDLRHHRSEHLHGKVPGEPNFLLTILNKTMRFSLQECVNEEDGSRFNHEIIPNKTVCLNETGALWVNPRITFDNVPLAYLALFQIATFKVHISCWCFLGLLIGILKYRF